MANNYRQFSEQITDLNDEACAWLDCVLALDFKEDHDELYKELCLTEDSTDDVEDWPDFEWRVKEGNFWVYAYEGGNTDHVALIVQALIKKFMPNYIFALTTADYCDKPRLGEFGGTWMVVTKDEVAGGSVWDEVDDWIKRHHPAHQKEAASESMEEDRCPHDMFYSGAGACPQCGG